MWGPLEGYLNGITSGVGGGQGGRGVMFSPYICSVDAQLADDWFRFQF